MALKALLVGINEYPDPADRLRGCRNDVAQVRELLTARYDLAEYRVLCDAEATSQAILDGLRWLAEPDADGSGVRLFHFSGHGVQIADTDNDEEDGADECLAPHDYASSGALSDDRLREAYRAFGGQAHLVLLMDCCHSGTISRDADKDISYRFLTDRSRAAAIAAARAANAAAREAFVKESMRNLSVGGRQNLAKYKIQRQQALDEFAEQHYGLDTLEGDIVVIAACTADQRAADARLGEGYHGALTYHLVEALRQATQPLSYVALIEQAAQAINAGDFSQRPQLECSEANRQRLFLSAAR